MSNDTQEYFLKEWHAECYKKAIKRDATGKICSFCGKINDFFDDCGWFYFPTAGCRECHNGPIGTAWIKKYGVGDR